MEGLFNISLDLVVGENDKEIKALGMSRSSSTSCHITSSLCSGCSASWTGAQYLKWFNKAFPLETHNRSWGRESGGWGVEGKTTCTWWFVDVPRWAWKIQSQEGKFQSFVSHVSARIHLKVYTGAHVPLPRVNLSLYKSEPLLPNTQKKQP